MLYINFSDNSIDIIQTKKNLINGEKVVAVARKDIPEGLVVNGLVVEAEKLIIEINNIFSLGYPKVIKDKVVTLAIPDRQVFTYRFSVPSSPNEDISKYVIEEAKKVIPYDPFELEHFYKVVGYTSDKKDILYTATLKKTVYHFANFFAQFGVKLEFAASSSFVIFEVLKSVIGKDEKILYAHIDKKTLEFFIFDSHGPVSILDKKLRLKSLESEIKSVLEKFKENYSTVFSKIILGGEGSIEVHLKELTDTLDISIAKIGDIIDGIFDKLKVKLDTGGQTKILYILPVGLIFLAKSKTAPNFTYQLNSYDKTGSSFSRKYQDSDLAIPPAEKSTIGSDNIIDTKIQKIQEVSKTIVSEKRIENKKSTFLQIFTNKISIIIICTITVLSIIIGLFLNSNNITRVQLPFILVPTVTPTSTPIPTATPIPTIDPKLKRSDLKISVQNGTDRTGLAKTTADYLEGLGYKNIAKSNADRDNYENTVVKIKQSKKNYLFLIDHDLQGKFDTANVEKTDETSKYDVYIILGKK